ncbi:fibroin heavy chain-like isoform X2 [Thalassophryne amazonica]|uniref:fibroin heavy chain-like isoform X2 n=1 Tax=Thalassophryne amazonica TaxID=390379 RepID=UPI0014709B96|nr:fibroin heavy chain-like isoform X2 [Thalassophryne amazonica]
MCALTGYGEGATGHLGAVAGNGFGYGNGYSNGYGAALGAEGLGGQLQGVYGGGAVELPYGAGPIIPSGLESEGVYPYAAQQLSLGSEGAKAASKYGVGVEFGSPQTGFGAQLGPAQEALGDQAGKYDGVNVALGNGYKG